MTKPFNRFQHFPCIRSLKKSRASLERGSSAPGMPVDEVSVVQGRAGDRGRSNTGSSAFLWLSFSAVRASNSCILVVETRSGFRDGSAHPARATLVPNERTSHSTRSGHLMATKTGSALSSATGPSKADRIWCTLPRSRSGSSDTRSSPTAPTATARRALRHFERARGLAPTTEISPETTQADSRRLQEVDPAP